MYVCRANILRGAISKKTLSTITKCPMGLNCESVVIYSSEYVCNPNGYFAYTKLFLMQTERTSKKVQGTELTKEQMNEQFNIATKELFSQFSYEDIKPSIDNLLLGWIGSDFFELRYSSKKGVEIFDFFNKLLIFVQKAELKYDLAEKEEVSISWGYDFFNSTFDQNYKDVKKYFKLTLLYFLENEFSDDNLRRNDVLYKVESMQKYLKKIYKIKQIFDLQQSIIEAYKTA